MSSKTIGLSLSLAAPHAAQAKVIEGSKRFNVLCCGRRWGKTMWRQSRLLL